MKTLTVFSRPECHLCDVMIAELTEIVDGTTQIEVVDISDDDDLEAEYGLRIPVLVAGDVELCCYRLNGSRVREFLSGGA